MTATLTAVPATSRTPVARNPVARTPTPTSPAATGAGLDRLRDVEPAIQGHLPRPARRVPLRAVPAPAAVEYGRRRLVAGLAAVVLLVAVVLAARAGLAWLGDEATAGDTSPAPAATVAGPGDSYWSLAERLHAGGDIRSTVDALRAANGGRELRPGDRVVLAG